MKFGILVHEADDDVGVAVFDLAAGDRIGAVTLEGTELDTIQLLDNIPLGHKVAIRDIAENNHIIEYGRPIGKSLKSIAKGNHVHVHNIKTMRWS